MSPIKLLYAIGRRMTSSWMQAISAHLIIHSSSSALAKKEMFSAIDPDISRSSCITAAMCSR